jgi:hypothetical protein
MIAAPAPSRTRTPARLRLIAAAALAFFAAGCAAMQPAPDGSAPDPGELWSSLTAPSAHEAQAFSANATLYHTGQGETHRLGLQIWGDFSLPVRLDVQAGIGATVLMLRESAEDMLALYPSDETAVIYRDKRMAMAGLGLDTPFSLADLARFLAGRFDGILPDTYVSHEITPDGLVVYTLAADSPVRTLAAGSGGLIHSLGGEGWSLVVERMASDTPEPGWAERILIELSKESQAALILKSFETRQLPWSPRALDLDIPAGTGILETEQILKTNPQ